MKTIASPDAGLKFDEKQTRKERQSPYRTQWPRMLKWVLALAVLTTVVNGVRLRPITVEVVRPGYRTVVESIAATGQVRGNVESDIGAPVGGRIAQLFVKEGNHVKRGQVLARLDERVLRAQMQQSADAVQTAQEQLIQISRPPLPSELAKTRADTKQAVDVARSQLASARQRLSELRRGPTQEERQQAAGQLQQANARLAQARLDFSRQQELFNDGKAQRGDLDRAETAYRVALEADEAAQAQLQQARLDVERQQELLRTSESAELERTQTAFQVAGKTLQRAQSELALANQELQRQRKLFDGGATPRSELDRAQANSEVAVAAVEQAKSQLEQARLEYERQQELLKAGIVPRAELERAQTALRVAQRNTQQTRAQREGAREELARQRQLFSTNNRAALDNAQSALRAAQGEAQTASARVRQLEVGTRQEEIAQAEAAVSSAQSTLVGAQESGKAALQTLLSQPRPEDVALARARLIEARQALEVARRRLGESVIRAPFAGVVTQVLTEVGGVTGANAAILRLVRIGIPELRIEVDETNLGRLKVGQNAIVTSDAFLNAQFKARVREIGSQVDTERGTVEVKLDPIKPPSWLRSGQTLNVNVIVNPGVRRLTLPLTAVKTIVNRSRVLVVREGYAREHPVTVGPAGQDGIPILSGLSDTDQVLVSQEGIAPGQRIRPIEKTS